MRLNVECDECKTKYGTSIMPGEKIDRVIYRICPACKKNNMLVFEKFTELNVYDNLMLLAEFYNLDPIVLEFAYIDTDNENLRGLIVIKPKENEPSILESQAHSPGNILSVVRHLLRYKFLSLLCNNKDVLDIGCGTGYGSYILSKTALSVKGIDLRKSGIEFAKKHFKKDNLSFENITIEEESDKNIINRCCANIYDIITCVETFEHINPIETPSFFTCLKNLVKDDGLIAFTTPRSEPTISYRKTAEFREYISHYAEYSKDDFFEILEGNGLKIEQYLLQKYDGGLIYNIPKNLEFSFSSPLDSYVQIAICRKD